MRPFIYGARNGIHIIDLDQTAVLFKRAYDFVVRGRGSRWSRALRGHQAPGQPTSSAKRRRALASSSSRAAGSAARSPTSAPSRRASSAFASSTACTRTARLEPPKKEQIGLRREQERLEKYLGGIKMMNALPVGGLRDRSATTSTSPSRKRASSASRSSRSRTPTATPTSWTSSSPATTTPSARSSSSRASIADACIEGQQKRRAMQQGGGERSMQSGDSPSRSSQRNRRAAPWNRDGPAVERRAVAAVVVAPARSRCSRRPRREASAGNLAELREDRNRTMAEHFTAGGQGAP
jgi:small subunit ribosomal protein S2